MNFKHKNNGDYISSKSEDFAQQVESKKTETWFSGYRHFQIGLNKNLTEYCTWETHNDRTIKKKTEIITVSNI